MAVRVRISALEQALWQVLTPLGFNIVQESPRTRAELEDDQHRIVLSFVTDPTQGNRITRQSARPVMRFTVYALSYGNCRQVQESIMEAIEANFADINAAMSEECAVWANDVGQFGAALDNRNDAYFCWLDVQFAIAKGTTTSS